MKKKATLKKPTLTTDAVVGFAEAPAKPVKGHTKPKVGKGISDPEKRPSVDPTKGKSGLVPDNDVRLSANIDRAIHLKLKIAAAEQRTTIGELIEKLVTEHLDN